MKLGKQTNSMTNHILARAVKGQPEPVIGMGATLLGWTDRQAGTIVAIEIDHGRTIVKVQLDTATRTDANGLSESQSYRYEPNQRGSTFAFRRARDGQWRQVEQAADSHRWHQVDGYGLRIGERDHYYDFSF